VCHFPTKAACDEAYAKAQAKAQVLLALRILASDRREKTLINLRKETSAFAQLVLFLAGERATIDGKAPFTRRLLDTAARMRADTEDEDAVS
jgi:hypothetical protein